MKIRLLLLALLAISVLRSKAQSCYISGNFAPCDTGVYQYSFNPPFSTENIWWYFDGTYGFLSSTSGFSTSLQIDSTVSGTLTVGWSEWNGNWPTEYSCSVLIEAGPPGPPNIAQGISTCPGSIGTFFDANLPVPENNSYTWTFPNGWVAFPPFDQSEITAFAPDNVGYVYATSSNTCGVGPTDSLQLGATNFQMTGYILGNGLWNGARCGDTLTLTFHASGPTSQGDATHFDGLIFDWGIPSNYTIVSSDSNSIQFIIQDQPIDVPLTVSNDCGSFNTSISIWVEPHTPVALISSDASQGNGIIYAVSGNEYEVHADSTWIPFLSADSLLWSVPEGYEILSGQGTSELHFIAGTQNGAITLTQYYPCQQTLVSEMSVLIGSDPCQIQNAEVFDFSVGDEFHYLYHLIEINNFSSWWPIDTITTRYTISQCAQNSVQGNTQNYVFTQTNFELIDGVWQNIGQTSASTPHPFTGNVNDTLDNYYCQILPLNILDCESDTMVKFNKFYMQIDGFGEQAVEYSRRMNVAPGLGIVENYFRYLYYYIGTEWIETLVYYNKQGGPSCGSPMLSVPIPPLPNTISIWPNPSDGLIQISDMASANGYDYQLISSDGRKTESGHSNSNQLNLRHLNSGYYFMKIFIRDRQYTFPIVIVH